MTGPTPEIRARLVADDTGAIAALRELADQLRRVTGATDQTKKSTQGLNKEYDRTLDAVGSLATALGAARLAQFAKDTINLADQVGKLAQKTGLTAETLSTLAFAGQTADVDIQQLQTNLRRFPTALTELQRGAKDVAFGFREIGLSVADLQGLTPDQALARVAEALGKLPDGFRKADAATRIFGKSGQELIPLLNQLAEDGFAKTAEAARRAGVLFDDSATKAAEAFNDELKLLKVTAQGLTFAFVRDFLPALTGIGEGMREVVTGLPEGFKNLTGAVLGATIAVSGLAAALAALKLLGITSLLTNPAFLAAVGVGAVFLSIAGAAGKVQAEVAAMDVKFRAWLTTLTGAQGLSTVNTLLEAQEARLVIITAQLAEQDRLEKERLQAHARSRAETPPAGNPELERLRLEKDLLEAQIRATRERRDLLTGPPEPPPLPDPDLLKAGADAARAAAEHLLRTQQEARRQDAAENDQAFAQGLRSLHDYYAERIRISELGAAQEIAALETARAAVQAEPTTTAAEALRQRTQVADLTQQIEARRLLGVRERQSLELEEAQKQIELADRRLALEQQVQRARGETLQASLDAIDKEAREFDKVLAKTGLDAAARASQVEAFRQTLRARASIEAVLAEAQRAFSEIERRRATIADLVQTGVLTELQGQREVAAFETDRLARLRALAGQAVEFAKALGPEAQAAAAALSGEVAHLAATANLAAQESARFLADLQSGATSVLATFLTDFETRTNAVVSLLRDLAATARQVAAEFIATRAVEGLRSLFGGGGGTQAAQLAAAGAAVTAGGIAVATGAGAATVAAGALTGAGGTLFAAAAALSAAAFALQVAMSAGSFGLFSTGVVLPGYGGGDIIPAYLEPGEAVIRKERVRALGPEFFAAVNDGFAPPVIREGRHYYSGGGIVPAPASGQGGMETGEIRAVLGLEEGLVVRHLETRAGRKALRDWAKSDSRWIQGLLQLGRD